MALRWMQSLKTKLIVLLTVALLPLGLVAVFQTLSLIKDADDLVARDLLARTNFAAAEQEALFRRAFGAAAGLGAIAAASDLQTEGCAVIMRRFVANNSEFAFAGFVAADGLMRCSSAEGDFDFSAQHDWVDFVANPRLLVTMKRIGPAVQFPVLVVLVPVFDPKTGSLIGGQAISVPNDLTDVLLMAEMEGAALAVFAADGTVLTASTGAEGLVQFEQLGMQPDMMVIPRSGVLVPKTDQNGTDFPVAIVPMIPGQIYAVAIWTTRMEPFGGALLGKTAPFFPLLMWLASLLVAILAVNRLVLRHLSRLSRQMNTFNIKDASHKFKTPEDAPREIRSITASYNALIDHVVADHKILQDNLLEKELLLREVHHRVKNNLQLIASILNMQIRGVRSEDARRILRRVQDRVMSLSTIHHALYSGRKVDAVRADRLLQEIVSAVLNLGLAKQSDVEIDIHLDPVLLDPDQAVPLSLLATEALTNATKYIGADEGKTPSIRFALRESTTGTVSLLISNSCGSQGNHFEDIDGSGLGSRLIEAFSSQLDGNLQVVEESAEYRVLLSFQKLSHPDENALG
ncbi:MAG: sensor histidine kinase [Rhodobacteraceae bacterium]|nr:sensor histidine kinase [Paracoccaceae bacterium]MCF8516406.1 sensor histidine kinase [Paracoccaceae bacterium]MCF8520756.1 sensor histidine kinase [Paracoccaceae bacterium]